MPQTITNFENALSVQRIQRFYSACNEDKAKGILLYKLNCELSTEIFKIIGMFEIALRNNIDRLYSNKFGGNWIKNSVEGTGMFTIGECKLTAEIIKCMLAKNIKSTHYEHVAAMHFSFWKYLFAAPQFEAGTEKLMLIFTNRPKSTAELKFNYKYCYSQLHKIHHLRNRIAHHEPICFRPYKNLIDLNAPLVVVNIITNFLQYMDLDTDILIYSRSKIDQIQDEINRLYNN